MIEQAKQEAKDLCQKFMEMPYPTHKDRAKQCVLILVERFILHCAENDAVSISYWEEVKKSAMNL
jgi:hypothetical protein